MQIPNSLKETVISKLDLKHLPKMILNWLVWLRNHEGLSMPWNGNSWNASITVHSKMIFTSTERKPANKEASAPKPSSSTQICSCLHAQVKYLLEKKATEKEKLVKAQIYIQKIVSESYSTPEKELFKKNNKSIIKECIFKSIVS